jgi:hypothetical protein
MRSANLTFRWARQFLAGLRERAGNPGHIHSNSFAAYRHRALEAVDGLPEDIILDENMMTAPTRR